MDNEESNCFPTSCQFSGLPNKHYVDNAEYTMVYSAGGIIWDFWLSEVEDTNYLESWEIKLRNKILSNDLQEMEIAKANELAIILLPTGLGARVKILTETTRDEFGAYNISVLDVDTGEMLTTYVDKVYIPDKELMTKEPFAVNCCLNLDRSSQNKLFRKHIKNGHLKVSFKRVTLSSPPKFVVDVYIKINGEPTSITNLLSAESTTARNSEAIKKDGSKNDKEGELMQYKSCKLERKTKLSEKGEAITDIYISHVDSVSRFYVWESQACTKELKSLMVELKSFYKSTTVHLPDAFISSLSDGLVCAVYDVKESIWCRAEIVNEVKKINFRGLLQKNYEVLLVDFGIRIKVPVSLIRPLNLKFCKSPVFAKRCHLFGIEPAPDFKSPDGPGYSKEVIEIFEMFLDLGKLTLIEASSRENDETDSIPVILERYYKGKDHVINMELLAQKLVTSSVFNLEVCTAILKNANKECIPDFSVDSQFTEGDESPEVMRQSEPKYEEAEGDESSEVVRQSEPKYEEAEDERSTYRISEPNYADSLDEQMNDWNPMEDDYKESEITYEGVINDDASAVIGYQAKDEARICKHYAKEGRCYKGAACRKEHTFIRPDGWTTDTQLVYGTSFSHLSLPKSGSQVKLNVTIVTDICKFYANLHDAWRYKETSFKYLPNEKCQEENVENLMELINSPVNVAKLRRLTMPAGVGEIVLCKMSPKHLYYRAQVIDTNLEENNFFVFYVDIGITEWVNVKNIRQIENNYLHLPFQAIECQLAYCGVPENIDGYRKIEIMRKLSDMISLKKINAYVVRSLTEINKMVVELFDDSGESVGEVLKNTGYLVEIPEMYENEIKFIPG